MKGTAHYFAVWVIALVLLWSEGNAQLDFARTLQRKLDIYYSGINALRLHVALDAPRYLAGDTAFFVVRLFTLEGEIISGRQLVNVQLANASGKVLYCARVAVDDGVGWNQIYLADDFSPGIYSLFASPLGADPGNDHHFFLCPLYLAGPRKFVAENDGNVLAFFPEGGRLVEGITQKVVVTGPPGGNVAVLEGANSVVSFSLDESGMGFFFCKPEAEARYKIALKGGMTESLDMPLPHTDGAGLMVTVPSNKSPLRITVQLPAKSRWRDEDLKLALTSRSTVLYVANLDFSGKEYVSFQLSQDRLPSGPAELTVFTSHGEPLAQRVLFIGSPSGNTSARISLASRVPAVREMLAVDVTLRNGQGMPVGGRFSATVFKNDSLFQGARREVFPHVVGGASLEASAGFVLGRDPASLDLFLITQTGHAVEWKKVWEERRPPAGSGNLQLAGRAFAEDGSPLPDATVITFLMQKSVMVYQATVDSAGLFRVPLLFDFSGEEVVYYRAEHNGKMLADAVVEFDEGFGKTSMPFEVRRSEQKDHFYEEATERRRITRAYALPGNGLSSVQRPALIDAIEEEVFGPDESVAFDDYTLFPTMSEMLREVVPALQYRKQKSRDVVRLFFKDRKRFAEGEPLFVIDNVITERSSAFLGLNPASVLRVSIISSEEKLNTFGAIGRNGLVLVETMHASEEPDEGSRAELHSPGRYVLRVVGLAAPVNKEVRALPPGRRPRVPDLRTRLFWHPGLEVSSEGNTRFFVPLSDVTGDYRIVIEGFTDEGAPFRAERMFTVRFKGGP